MPTKRRCYVLAAYAKDGDGSAPASWLGDGGEWAGIEAAARRMTLEMALKAREAWARRDRRYRLECEAAIGPRQGDPDPEVGLGGRDEANARQNASTGEGDAIR